MLLALLPSLALAADLAPGTPIAITDVSPEDAYVDMKDEIVGQRCTVGAGGLAERRPGWHGGNVTCLSQSYFFFEVAVDVLGAPAPVGAPEDHGATLPTGTSFRLADIHPDDAYHSDKATYVGRRCTTTGDLNAMETGWYAGPADCEGQSMYFYKAAVNDVQVGVGGGVVGGVVGPVVDQGETIPGGTRFRIADIHPEDAYHSDRAEYIGLSCTVASDGLNAQDTGWYSGAASCDQGFEPYFYKVAVTLEAGAARGFTERKLAKGLAVRIVDAPGLPPTLQGVIGQVCVTAGTMKQVGPGRYAGKLACEGLKLKVSNATLARP